MSLHNLSGLRKEIERVGASNNKLKVYSADPGQGIILIKVAAYDTDSNLVLNIATLMGGEIRYPEDENQRQRLAADGLVPIGFPPYEANEFTERVNVIRDICARQGQLAPGFNKVNITLD